MKLEKFLIGIGAVLAAIALIMWFINKLPVQSVVDHTNGPVTICHYTPSHYVVNTPNKSANVGGHNGHSNDIIPPFDYWQHFNPPGPNNDFWLLLPYLGKNWDEEGQAIYRNDCQVPEPVFHYACVENACTKVEGEGQNTCEEDDDCAVVEVSHLACQNLACVKVEGEGEDSCKVDEDCQETVPPPVTETSTPFHQPEAPVCPDGRTTKLPEFIQVVRSGSDATVKFFITEGDSANIYYKVVDASGWQHSVIDVKPNSDKYVEYTIHDLDPKLGYTFGVQQKFGCGTGEIATGVVVDGPSEQVFNLSFWTF